MWAEALDGALGDTAFLARIGLAHARAFRQARAADAEAATPPPPPRQCWDTPAGPREARAQASKGAWFRCCSHLAPAPTPTPPPTPTTGCFATAEEAVACCTFGPGSDSHLSIPALHSVAVTISVTLLGEATTVAIDQAGFLRLFDMPTVLWPAGYLLAQWQE